MNKHLMKQIEKQRAQLAIASEMDDIPEKVKREVITQYDVPYRNDGNKEHLLDIFRPVVMQVPPPVIINIHGGGLVSGNKEYNRHFCMLMCLEGYLVFSVEYPLCPEVTVFHQLQDIYAAMNYIESVLPQYKATPGCAYMVGDSAGAYLALYATAIQRNPKLTRAAGIQPAYLQVLGLGLISGMFFTTGFDPIGILLPEAFYGKGYKKHPFYPYLDPSVPDVCRYLPPCMIVTSKYDRLRHYSTKMREAIRRNGGKCILNDCGDNPKLLHAFSVMNPEYIESKNVIRDIALFFEDI